MQPDTEPVMSVDALNLVRELIGKCELEAVEIHELSAKRSEDFAGEIGEAGSSADVEFILQHRIANDSFGIRLTGRVHAPIGEAKAVVSAEYALTDGYTPTKATVLNFANEVAVMTLYPYFREAISSTSARVLPRPFLVPIVGRGDLRFVVED